jgi:hypothetical protein
MTTMNEPANTATPAAAEDNLAALQSETEVLKTENEALKRENAELRARSDLTRAAQEEIETLRARVRELESGEATQQKDAEPAQAAIPKQGFLWTGDDEKGYLGHVPIGGEVYAVTPVNVGGSEHFKANIITGLSRNSIDSTLPATQLANRYGMSLYTYDPKSRRHTPIKPAPTADEAKAQCEADYYTTSDHWCPVNL